MYQDNLMRIFIYDRFAQIFQKKQSTSYNCVTQEGAIAQGNMYRPGYDII